MALLKPSVTAMSQRRAVRQPIRVGVLLLAGVLAGCRTPAPAPPPPAAEVSSPPPAAVKHMAHAKHARKVRPPAPVVNLVGLSEAKTAALLGPPDSAVNVGPSQVWTYRATGCTLVLTYFLDVNDNEYDALSRSVTGTDGSEKQAQHCIRQIISHARAS